NPTGGTTQTGGTSSASTTLPASVGENPFSGKTYTAIGEKWEFADTTVKYTKYAVSFSSSSAPAKTEQSTASETNDSTSTSNSSESSLSNTVKTNPIVFYNHAAQETVEVNENEFWIYECNYSYDATKQVLYLITKTYEGQEDERKPYTNTNGKISNVTDYVEYYKKNITNWTTDTEAYYTDYCSLMFSEIKAKKYEVTGDSLKMTDYFTGDILLSQETGNGMRFYIKGGLRIVDMEGDTYSSSSSGISLRAFPKFKDGKFSGNAYKYAGNSTYEKVGIVEGSYSTSEPGIGSWHAKLNFTTLPAGLTYIQTGVEYTLSSSGNSSYDTYTLVN
ncbi:MAG: hypothetical protein IKO39_06515, partial [Treponema sp.]|nr:hypothetical protein [Treponema sp.]